MEALYILIISHFCCNALTFSYLKYFPLFGVEMFSTIKRYSV